MMHLQGLKPFSFPNTLLLSPADVSPLFFHLFSLNCVFCVCFFFFFGCTATLGMRKAQYKLNLLLFFNPCETAGGSEV